MQLRLWRPVCIAAAAALALLSCGRERDVATLLPRTPLEHLHGISIGMTVRQVRAARPNVARVPYGGLSESIGVYTVTYQFPDAAATLASSARLDGILMAETYETADETLHAWHRAVSDVVRRVGRPDSCHRLVVERTGTVAVWNIANVVTEISARDPMSSGTEVVPFRIIYSVRKSQTPRPTAQMMNCT